MRLEQDGIGFTAPLSGFHKMVYVYIDERPCVFLFILRFYCFSVIMNGWGIFIFIQGYIHIYLANTT
ncbi:hypothetical protein H1P_6390005 [Hyella patelloides LEGE 07179]|uniref:Transmembrane protein n=1 Tax=Hyella patelloides LEGE 07179 TaxID=945734 RepID=A0A563W1Z6_9CYAN|nr:hypothetical protein H1P_6390005 [Hyella patelloides LEGE 07179]